MTYCDVPVTYYVTYLSLSLFQSQNIFYIFIIYTTVTSFPEDPPNVAFVCICARGACMHDSRVLRKMSQRGDSNTPRYVLTGAGASRKYVTASVTRASSCDTSCHLVTQKNPPGHNNQVGNISIKIFLVIVHSGPYYFGHLAGYHPATNLCILGFGTIQTTPLAGFHVIRVSLSELFQLRHE